MLVGTYNQEKALVGAFSVIVKTSCGTDGALYSTAQNRTRIWTPALIQEKGGKHLRYKVETLFSPLLCLCQKIAKYYPASSIYIRQQQYWSYYAS